MAEDSASFCLEALRQKRQELQVHQVELEMQNEELRRTQAQAEAAWARYSDLYDLRLLREGGTAFWAHLVTTAVTTPGSHECRVVVNDIHQAKQTEAALQQSEERLALALQAFRTIPYDLLLMDVQMPKMDGFQATREIRNPHSGVLNKQVPIIAMTAQAGMDDYVTKPIEVSALVAALKKSVQPKAPHCPPLASEEEIPVFNRAALLRRVMDDEELARSVITGFLRDMPGQIKQLKDYAAAGEPQNAGKQAHKIKGACATLGGEALCALAAGLEQVGQAGNLATISARMKEVDAQFAALKKALEANNELAR